MPRSDRLTLGATTGELQRLHGWLTSLGAPYQLSDQVAFRLDLCLTELVTNVINYAYCAAPPPEAAITVLLVRTPTEVCVEIGDRGIEFDPVAYVPRPEASSLETAEAGGRGLILVRRFATGLAYRREGEYNKLSFTVPAPPEAMC